MSPEQTAVSICTLYLNHCVTRGEEAKKPCPACQKIADAIRDAVAKAGKRWANRLDDTARLVDEVGGTRNVAAGLRRLAEMIREDI